MLGTALLEAPGLPRPGDFGQELATPVGALVMRRAEFVSPEDTVADAARFMREAKISSALVSSEPLGILTSGDLRNRVLAEELAPTTLVSAVMTTPVRSLPVDAPLYTALLLMLDEGFEHVPITDSGKVIGVVTQKDMLRFQSRIPMLLLGRIRSIDAVEDLDGYAEHIATTAKALLADGVEAARIARVIASLNDALSGRLLRIAEDHLGPPPCEYTWLALGSEGRMEQVLLSDQDNALVYQDDTPAAAAYFHELAGIVVDGLTRAGFAPCPGGYMAVNWAHPLSRWQHIFRNWVGHPEPQALIEAAVFLDYRAAHGSLSVQPLREELLAARNAPPFLAALARTASSFAPPLGMLGRIRTEERFVDLKRGGLAAIVILARIYAMEAGVHARPTLERLAAAGAQGVISERGAAELADAFRFLMYLRLREQLGHFAAGREPENRICYDDLTWLERRRLRDAFRTVAEMQKATIVRLHAV